MSQDELKKGQQWVEEALVRLLAERGVKLDVPIKWTPNIDREIYVLEARMNGISKTWNSKLRSTRRLSGRQDRAKDDRKITSHVFCS